MDRLRRITAPLVGLACLVSAAAAHAQRTAAPALVTLDASALATRAPAIRAHIGALKMRPIDAAARDLGAALRTALDGGADVDPQRPPPAVASALRNFLERVAAASEVRSADRVLQDGAAIAGAVFQDDLAAQQRRVATVQAKRQELQGVLIGLRQRAQSRGPFPYAFSFSVVRRGATGDLSFESTSRSVADMQALTTAIADVEASLDSLSEMGQMESLRLQMAMDRMSKMMSTLSNILKKQSDTAQSIIQNMR